MNNFNWKNRIREWSLLCIEALEDYEKDELSPEIVEPGYLGCPGATEEEIEDAEARNGVSFPPSYREFLKVSNGLRSISTSDDNILFYPVEEIDWFAVGRQERIDAWIEAFKEIKPIEDEEYFIYDNETWNLIRFEYLQTCIEISVANNKIVCLLNPQVVTSDGEWEAWFFDMHLVEAIRYRSFSEMMDMILGDPEYFSL
jgi:SMI1 / KNR4 family (SUKH-1)